MTLTYHDYLGGCRPGAVWYDTINNRFFMVRSRHISVPAEKCYTMKDITGPIDTFYVADDDLIRYERYEYLGFASDFVYVGEDPFLEMDRKTHKGENFLWNLLNEAKMKKYTNELVIDI